MVYMIHIYTGITEFPITGKWSRELQLIVTVYNRFQSAFLT